ncbi:dUTP diphosphatase [Metabacillus fastidiosus]|uniref:dUTP diphosphatase n=1 Tax=Metabacillus fastidiosus TaxID=1458 RepID=UPI003D2B8B81
MNLTKLFKAQKVLRERIIKQHNLEGKNLLPNMLLALQVELGELANETRCFKHWSKKGPSEQKVILEEYVDGVHFILEIGIELGLELSETGSSKVAVQFDGDETNTQFRLIYKFLSDLDFCSVDEKELYYKQVVSHFIGLGQMLGFTEEQIEQAYFTKNQINHERQEQGY